MDPSCPNCTVPHTYPTYLPIWALAQGVFATWTMPPPWEYKTQSKCHLLWRA